MRRREGETTMNDESIDRRLFLGAGASTLLAGASTLSGSAQAQQSKATKADDGLKPTEAICDFIAGFDLKNAPPLAVERARTAFIDTVGVMLAGTRSEP